MADPFSLIAAGAAIGGASGKVVEKAWDAGQKWLERYFQDHRDEALARAEENAAHFLADLAVRLSEVEDRLGRDAVEGALRDPDTAALVEQTVLSAGRTSDSQRHEVLSRLIAGRLSVSGEDLTARVSLSAIAAVELCTKRQLYIVALRFALVDRRPTWWGTRPPIEGFGERLVRWIEETSGPYRERLDENVTEYDCWHLGSAGLLWYFPSMSIGGIHEIFRPRDLRDVEWPYKEFIESDHGQWLQGLWRHLQSTTVTPAGMVVGSAVHASVTGAVIPVEFD